MAKRTTKSAPPSFTGSEKFVVLHGKESFLLTDYMQQLRAALEQTHGEIESTKYDPKSAFADIMDDLRSFSLMQQHKLIIVDAADEFVKNHRPALERYAAAPVDTATLLLRSEKWNKGNLDKAIAKVGHVVKCDLLSLVEAEQWTIARAKSQHQIEIEPKAAELLVDHLGRNLGLLDSELAKLAVSASESKAITTDQVKALVGHASDEDAWEIQEAILSAKPARAIAKLHELVNLSHQPDVLITYFVADLIKKLAAASAMIKSGQNEFAIKKELKIWGDRERPFFNAAKKLGTDKTAALLKTIVNLDKRAKSGFGQTTTNLERFCVQFADELN